MNSIYKSSLFFALFIFWTSIGAQSWQNPADKYKDAYKKYVNAICPIPKDSIQHFVYFAQDRESIIDHPVNQEPYFEKDVMPCFGDK